MPAVALVCLGLCALGAASEAPVLEVDVSVDRCLPVDRAEVERLTALELGARASGAGTVSAAATRVEVSCAGEHVKLRVVDPLTGKSLERTLSLTTREVDVAGRAIALAAAELVLTSWAELTLTKRERTPLPLRVATAPRPAAEERVLERTERGVRVDHLLAVAEVNGPFEGLGLGYGGGLRLGLAFGRGGFGAEWDFMVHRAEAETRIGSVDATLYSSGLFSRYRLESGPLRLDLAVGGRAGSARIAGTPRDAARTRGGVFAGAWAGPAAFVGAGARLGSLALRLGAEGGYVLRGVTGEVEGESNIAVAGAWLGLGLGFGWAP